MCDKIEREEEAGEARLRRADEGVSGYCSFQMYSLWQPAVVNALEQKKQHITFLFLNATEPV